MANDKTFEGWSNRYDEWISLYDPRIQPHLSKTNKSAKNRVSLKKYFYQKSIDRLRIVKSTDNMKYIQLKSPADKLNTPKLFIRLFEEFGNQGGFQLLLEALQHEEDYHNIPLTKIRGITRKTRKNDWDRHVW